MSERDTVALLCAWGEWSRMGCGSLRASSSMFVVMELVKPSSTRVDPDICDDDALRVDRAVAQLKMRNANLAEILKMYFRYQYSMREIERKLGLSSFNAAKLFASACGWIDCALNISASDAA